jgi:hypothetical protein
MQPILMYFLHAEIFNVSVFYSIRTSVQTARIHGYPRCNVLVVETHSLVVQDDGVMLSANRHRAFQNIGMAQILMPYFLVSCIWV